MALQCLTLNRDVNTVKIVWRNYEAGVAWGTARRVQVMQTILDLGSICGFALKKLAAMANDNTHENMSEFLQQAMFHFDDQELSDTEDVGAAGATDKNATYLERVYTMLEECVPTVAAWSKGGAAFVVFDTKALEAMYLPQYFTSVKFESFCRQLNAYRFQKIKLDANVFEFSHPEFIRGHRDKLGLIGRRRRVRKLNARVIDTMTDSEVRSTLIDVVAFVRAMQAELDETKAIIQSLSAENKQNE
ncbi:unnamed protein product [Aphanomyces euteiches]|uniref:HSF-type DNA-binding domain-containing protein n=1 Tax=Aphanomyces euteiches TaxID=100861 RepID=A0A6G0X5P4_9STRA|nr:hypothetical protein Ae201684_008391 [Aphanomyces euteiches]KAH9070614.1 hypothetical protein Ae201684P_002971 [Aphanomyces euteiches]KAH9157071.1 hypothetical protein AeRB84_001045 [Aphanomyces euteiches]